ncbi:MAG: OmpH family outer membrane protein [Zoogloeaceae bacterium]|jgi:outer membrane protein|nr:OmpH family outer membrane protein [Zoogloeaceae bacterium]
MLKTKSILAVSLGAAFAALTSVAAQAQAADLKVGYVDTQRIFRIAPSAIDAAKKIETEFSKRDQELQRLEKQLRTLQETAERDAPTMSENQRRAKEREFSDLSRDFQRKQREFREDLSLRQNEANAAIIEKANKAIKQIADSEKYDLILQDVVWVSPRLDITDKVVKALSDGK